MDKPQAFTLIELLIYLAVVLLVMTAVGSLLVWSIRIETKAKIQSELLRSGDIAMSVMTRAIADAQKIYGPTSALGISPGQLSLRMRPAVQGGEYVYVDFFVCQTALCKKKEGQNPITLTTENIKVTNLMFSRIGSEDFPSVKIVLSLEYNSLSQKPEYRAVLTLQSSAAIRVPIK